MITGSVKIESTIVIGLTLNFDRIKDQARCGYGEMVS